MNHTERKDVKTEITQAILEQLEKGVKPWEYSWDRASMEGIGLPKNHHSNKSYRGINVLSLWMGQSKHQFSSNRWMTYKQAAEMGGQVQKGSKGTRIIFYKELEIEDAKNDETKKIPMIKGSTVFNLDQIDGIDRPELVKGEHHIQHAQDLIDASGAKVQKSGVSAFYNRTDDFINMPVTAFTSDEAYYATFLHELTHWTGAEHRLARKKGKTFGDPDYCFEELVAEIGSAFVCAQLGLASQLESHAGYLDMYIKRLKEDNGIIFKAASQASKAHDYLFDMMEKANIQAA